MAADDKDPTLITPVLEANSDHQSSHSVEAVSDTGISGEPPNQVAPDKPAAGSRRFFPVLLLLVLFLALSIAGYLGYLGLMSGFESRLAHQEQRLNREILSIQAQLEVLVLQGSDLDAQGVSLQQSLTAATHSLEAQMSALSQRVAENEAEGSADWTLAEAEYLLRIANQRLLTSRDIAGAIEMMEAADGILVELAYPELVEARRQLVDDMTRLQLVSRVDVEGMYFALDTLSRELAQMQQSRIEYLSSDNDSEADSSNSGWGYAWDQIKSALSKYVRIESDAGEPRYLLSAEQKVLRISAVQLRIRQAQLALLAGQQQPWSEALVQAAATVEQYFGHEGGGNNSASGLVQALRDMSERQVVYEAMDINGSIQQLRTVIDQLARVAR